MSCLHKNLDGRAIPNHTNFGYHTPFERDKVPAGATTHTRKDQRRIQANQKPITVLTGDYCWVAVNDLMFLNVYKAP